MNLNSPNLLQKTRSKHIQTNTVTSILTLHIIQQLLVNQERDLLQYLVLLYFGLSSDVSWHFAKLLLYLEVIYVICC